MKRWLSLSLFKKIFIIGVSCLLVSLWGVTWMNAHAFKEGYLESIRSNARAISMRFDEEIVGSLMWGGDFKEVAREIGGLALFFTHPDFRGILTQVGIVSIEGEILAHVEKKKVNQSLPPHILQVLQEHSNESSRVPFQIKENGSYDVYVPIFFKEKLQGFFVVGFAAPLIDDKISNTLYTAIVVTLISLVLAALAFIWSVSRYVTGPLGYIVQKIRYITQSGDLSIQLQVQSKDEILDLAESFNKMTHELVKKGQALKTYADSLKQKNEELKRADQMKDEFLANTSHELRTPLNGIIGIAESLIEGIGGRLSPLAQQNLELIVQSAQRLTGLVNQILEFAKLRNQEIVLHLKPLGMWEVVEVVLTLSQPLLGKKNLSLLNRVSPNLPLVLADENRVQQILINLVGNAIKFSDQGVITVTAEVNGHFLEVSVRDTGIGIAADKFELIFEPFRQADGSTERRYGGTGLGLSVTKTLVELHKGQIQVQSQLKKGSCFTFSLPLVSASEEVSTVTSPHAIAQVLPEAIETPLLTTPTLAKEPLCLDDQENSAETVESPPSLANNQTADIRSPHYTILVADDEPINLQVLINHLTLEKYTVWSAHDGIEAVRVLERCKPDLVLLDVMMPNMTGYEACKKIRERHSMTALPILFLTAKNQISDLVHGFSLQANDYLIKPFSRAELLARVKQHLSLAASNIALHRSNFRLSLLLDLTRYMATSRDKFDVMVKAANSILHEISVHPNAQVEIFFQERDLSHNDRYARFLIPACMGSDGKLMLQIDSTKKLDHIFSLEIPVSLKQVVSPNSRIHQGSFLTKNLLSVPVLHDEQLLGGIEIHNVDQEHFQQEHKNFVDTLSQSLGIALKNINFTLEMSEKIRMETELKTAATVQKAIFPKQLPLVPCLELASFFRSATESGGDWYGFMTQIENSLLIMIGDVTGHGIPSALVTATVSATCRTLEEVYYQISQEPSPAKLQAYLNKMVFAAGHPNFLMTFFIAHIDLETGLMTFSNAAHNLPILLRSNGRMRRLINVNGRLGSKPESNFTESSVQLEVGDTLFFYTDGVTENTNPRGHMWGEQNLIHYLKEHQSLSAQELLDGLTNQIYHFYAGQPLEDDLTMLTCKVVRPFAGHTWIN